MRKGIVWFLLVFAAYCVMLCPGVWWPDSLNAFIQQKTGLYGAAQPPLLAFICGFSSMVMPTPLPLFLSFTLLYTGGLAYMVFAYIKNRVLAPVLYLTMSFFPLTFASIGVVQTETLQVACLAAFVPLTLCVRKGTRSGKVLCSIAAAFLLLLFVLARYESLILSIPLAYLLVDSIFDKQRVKIVAGTLLLVVGLQFSAIGLQRYVGVSDRLKTEMQLTLLVNDLAAISVESNQNFVPEYCWQDYLPQTEKTIESIAKGYYGWKGAFYSYTFSVDPAVGLFKSNIYEHRSKLIATWISVVTSHLHYYLWYHTKLFVYLITNDYFEMGLWSGIKDSGEIKSRLVVEDTVAAKQFVELHSNRFYYTDQTVYFRDSNFPINDDEFANLCKLVSSRRQGDVVWMKWYSNVPTAVFANKSKVAETVLLPLFSFLRTWFRFFCTQAPYVLLLFVMFCYSWRKIKQSENRFYILVLCGCGLAHIAMRFVFLTDTVFRFGLLALVFLLLAMPLLLSEILSIDEQ